MRATKNVSFTPVSISFWGVLPGLVLLVVLEVAYWAGGPMLRSWLASTWSAWLLLLLALSIAYLLVTRKPPSALGYRRDRAFAFYMRGVAAGALWRLFSMLTNYFGWWDVLPGAALGLPWAGLLSALVVVPLLEETVFRGYLQAGLETCLGPALAVVVQALLFALHPAHAAQGWRAFPSVFTFGLLAGVLFWRARSIWIVLGAHGLANVLPYIVRGAAGWIYGQ